MNLANKLRLKASFLRSVETKESVKNLEKYQQTGREGVIVILIPKSTFIEPNTIKRFKTQLKNQN